MREIYQRLGWYPHKVKKKKKKKKTTTSKLKKKKKKKKKFLRVFLHPDSPHTLNHWYAWSTSNMY